MFLKIREIPTRGVEPGNIIRDSGADPHCRADSGADAHILHFSKDIITEIRVEFGDAIIECDKSHRISVNGEGEFRNV